MFGLLVFQQGPYEIVEEPPPGAVGAAAAAWDVKVSSFSSSFY